MVFFSQGASAFCHSPLASAAALKCLAVMFLFCHTDYCNIVKASSFVSTLYMKIVAFVCMTFLPDPNRVAKFMLNFIIVLFSWVGSEDQIFR